MMIRTRLLFVLLFVSNSVVLFTLGVTDPELKQCKQLCKAQQQFDEEVKRDCSKQCEKYFQEKQRRQREEGRRGVPSSDQQKQFRLCLEHCQSEAVGRYQEEGCHRQCEEKLQGDEEESPYVFEEQHFITKFENPHGRVRVLPKFTERSELLKGIENYCLSVLEVEPLTFVVPNHWDAEGVLFVAHGQGTMSLVRAHGTASLVRQDHRQSFDIVKGDIVRVPAGTTNYLINRDNSENLIIVNLLLPVSNPGHFESFFGAGGENLESYFQAFSVEVLEAAFNTRRDRFQRIFGEPNQGIFVKASQEQIKALSHNEDGWEFPSWEGARGVVSIFNRRPSEANDYGKLYQFRLNGYRLMRDLDISVSFENISRGGMSAPMYSSRATKISFVVHGKGYLEMACPHSSQGSQQQWDGASGSRPNSSRSRKGLSYQKVRARLRRGMAIVFPPGHPFVVVASNNQNLEIVSFEINSYMNRKYLLSGKKNVINQMEKEAKELAFGVPAQEVEEVFNSQQDEYFLQGPHQQQQQGGHADA